MTSNGFANLEDKQAGRNRKSFPGGGTLAELVRDGATIADLCDLYGVGKTVVYTRLRDSGYGPDGNPRVQQMSARPAEAPFLQSEEAWMESRGCAKADPDMFHAEGAGSKFQTAAAKQICLGCPVRDACLDYALRIEKASVGRYGVYGGLTGDERAALMKNK